MNSRLMVGAVAVAAAATACADDQPDSPTAGIAAVVDGDGLVYEAPVTDKPPPLATLPAGTPVTIECKAPEPGEMLEHSEPLLSAFYEISYDGGSGYTRQHDVELANAVDYQEIPEC